MEEAGNKPNRLKSSRDILVSRATLYIGMAKHVLSSHLILVLSHSLTRQVPSLMLRLPRCTPLYVFLLLQPVTKEKEEIQGLFCNKV